MLSKNKRGYIQHSALFIYADVINPRCVGNKILKCLRVPPFNEKSKCFEFKSVEIATIKDVSILILSANGAVYNFCETIIPTYIILHFRKKKAELKQSRYK